MLGLAMSITWVISIKDSEQKEKPYIDKEKGEKSDRNRVPIKEFRKHNNSAEIVVT